MKHFNAKTRLVFPPFSHLNSKHPTIMQKIQDTNFTVESKLMGTWGMDTILGLCSKKKQCLHLNKCLFAFMVNFMTKLLENQKKDQKGKLECAHGKVDGLSSHKQLHPQCGFSHVLHAFSNFLQIDKLDIT